MCETETDVGRHAETPRLDSDGKQIREVLSSRWSSPSFSEGESPQTEVSVKKEQKKKNKKLNERSVLLEAVGGTAATFGRFWIHIHLHQMSVCSCE